MSISFCGRGRPTPGPGRRCRTRQWAFLIERDYSPVPAAAKAARIGRRRHYYHWMKQDPQYRAAFTEVKEDLFEQLYEEARRRAVEGDLQPIFYNGVQSGTVRRKSERLLMFLLQLEMPEQYGHRRRSRAKAGPGAPADLAERLNAGRARGQKSGPNKSEEHDRKVQLKTTRARSAAS